MISYTKRFRIYVIGCHRKNLQMPGFFKKSAKTLGLHVQLKVALILSFEFILSAELAIQSDDLTFFIFLAVPKWVRRATTDQK
jgi:hypothetical protein